MKRNKIMLTLFALIAIGSTSCEERLSERPPAPCDCMNGDEWCCDEDEDICTDYQYYAANNPTKIKSAVDYTLVPSDDACAAYLTGVTPDGAVYIVRPADTGANLEWDMDISHADFGMGTMEVNTTDYPKGTYQRVMIGDTDYTEMPSTSTGTETMWVNGGTSFNGGNWYNGKYVNLPTSFGNTNAETITIGIDDSNNSKYKIFNEFGTQTVQLSNEAGTTYQTKACHDALPSEIHMIGRGYTGKAPHFWSTGFDYPSTPSQNGDAPYQYGLAAADVPASWMFDSIGPAYPVLRVNGGPLWRRSYDVNDYTTIYGSYTPEDNMYWADLNEANVIVGNVGRYQLKIKAAPSNFCGSAYQNASTVSYSISNMKINGVTTVDNITVTEDASTAGTKTFAEGTLGVPYTKIINIDRAYVLGEWHKWVHTPTDVVPYALGSQHTGYIVTFDVTISFSGGSGGDLGSGTTSYTVELLNTQRICHLLWGNNPECNGWVDSNHSNW